MFDTQVSLLTIDAGSSQASASVANALLLKGCRLIVRGQGRMYSEFEEMTFDPLNQNDYEYGTLEIELICANGVTKKPYPKFYTKCFVLRTDAGSFIKPMKIRNNKCFSKVNQNGDMLLGIRYFFRSKDEIDKIQSCSSLLLEGFIAIGSTRNVFGFMCQLEKRESAWHIEIANTYKPDYAKNIKSLID